MKKVKKSDLKILKEVHERFRRHCDEWFKWSKEYQKELKELLNEENKTP